MDHSPSLMTSTDSRDDVAARNRFESFKLGKGLPPAHQGPKHAHARSHSRGLSISTAPMSSLSPSPSFPSTSSKSTSMNDLSSFSFPRSDSATSVAPPLVPSSKRNSHHRRRSSVSTRHESAELMGVTLPDLPPSASEDNINLGEKDSIRRRALWALEGKPDVSFAKVEIPELSKPEVEKMMFDFATKSSLSASAGSGFGSGLGPLMGGASKRDSFKLLASSGSSKDQLGTLVEEEEEEEEVESKPQDSLPSPAPSVTELPTVTPITPSLSVTKPTPFRPRPANLNLRPLSLTPENLVTTVQGLPTPSLTPSPRSSLSASAKRNSVIISPTPPSRRPSLNLNLERCESPASDDGCQQKPARRSSISYKTSSHGVITNLAGLPTPEATPTFARDRRYSGSESIASPALSEDGFFPATPATQFARPLSASEQHFLFKSHNALLARITDLERALSMQRRRSSGGYSSAMGAPASRRDSTMSSSTEYSSSNSDLGSGPDDEMLRLIADLKAERDELKRDVDGWRMRVGDMEKQLGVVTKRVDIERRDAWVARSRVGLLEVEKGVLEKRLGDIERMFQELEEEKKAWSGEKCDLEKKCAQKSKRIEELEDELASVRQELERERAMRKEAEAALNAQTPSVAGIVTRKKVTAFTSVDSSSSTTDVELESPDTSFNRFGFPLKAVQEESDDISFSDDEDNGLVGYEDEDEDDEAFDSSSSFGSMDEFTRSTSLPKLDVPVRSASPSSGSSTATLRSRSASPVTPPSVFTAPVEQSARPTHAPRNSLSKAWTFPKSAPAQSSAAPQEEDDNDRFFGCLEDPDLNGEGEFAPTSPSTYSYERSKSLFASGFKYGGDDDNAPFFVPGHMGFEAEEEPADMRLASVAEEEEEEGEEHLSEVLDDSDMFGEVGGITIIFTPPDEEEEEEEVKSLIQIVVTPVKNDLPPVLPALNFGDDDEEDDDTVPFNFGRPSSQRAPSPVEEPASPPARVPSPPAVFSKTMVTPPSAIPRPASPRSPSPSSIPRAMNSRPLMSSSEIFSFSPPKTPSPPAPAARAIPIPPLNFSSSAYVTPPTKRGGTMPSFIPQPVSSPSPMRTAVASAKPRPPPPSTFMRQPPRKLMMAPSPVKSQNSTGVANGSTFIPQPAAILDAAMNTRSLRRSSDDHAANSHKTSEMKSIDLSHPQYSHDSASPQRTHEYPHPTDSRPSSSVADTAASSFSSLMSSPMSARLSFQTFKSFIPLTWNPIAGSAVGSAASVAASLCHTPTYSHEQVDTNEIRAPSPLKQEVAAAAPPKRGYTSRLKQLEKLRTRMETEGMMTMRTAAGVHCKKCDSDLVVL